MAEHNDFGKIAEAAAADFLAQKNYKILAKNFRYQKAELDIIAMYGDLLVIAEVKARHSTEIILPQEAVNRKKIRNIILAANAYIEENNLALDTRFDIISVVKNADGTLKIEHLENAFESIDAS